MAQNYLNDLRLLLGIDPSTSRALAELEYIAERYYMVSVALQVLKEQVKANLAQGVHYTDNNELIEYIDYLLNFQVPNQVSYHESFANPQSNLATQILDNKEIQPEVTWIYNDLIERVKK